MGETTVMSTKPGQGGKFRKALVLSSDLYFIRAPIPGGN